MANNTTQKSTNKSLLQAYKDYDSAALTKLDILLTYSGFHAVCIYHFAHFLWRHKMRHIAKFISLIAKILTGIEIHPAARIGKNLIIDHGHGIVIGETVMIGDNVLIYQGVTLGGREGKKIMPDNRRHPKINDFVTIGASATVLGAIEVGTCANIGAGAVVLQDVPAKATAVGVPARIIENKGEDDIHCPYGYSDDAMNEMATETNKNK